MAAPLSIEEKTRISINDERAYIKQLYNEKLKDPEGIISYRNMIKHLKARLQELKRQRCKAYHSTNPYFIENPTKFPSDANINSMISGIERGSRSSDCLSSAPSEEEKKLTEDLRMFFFPDKSPLMKEYNQYNKNTQSKDPIPIHLYEKLPKPYQNMYNTSKGFDVKESPVSRFINQPSDIPIIVKYYPKKGGGKSKKQTKTRKPKRNPKRKSKQTRRR